MVIKIIDMHNGMQKDAFRVDRSSPVGNPFFISKLYDRDAVCRMYEVYFREVLLEDPEAIEYLDKMLQHLIMNGSITLACWCYPKRCHAETIKAWLLTKLSEVLG